MPNELYHNGIKGQRWGFRRFQNEDGSLTPEGRLRYHIGEEKRKAKLQIAKDKSLYKIQRNKNRLNKRLNKTSKVNPDEVKTKGVNKKTSDMSDEELRKRVERLRLELEYNQKVSQINPKKKTATEVIKPYLGKVAMIAVTTVSTALIKKAVDKMINNDKAKGAAAEASSTAAKKLSEELASETIKEVKKDVTESVKDTIKDVATEKVSEAKTSYDSDKFDIFYDDESGDTILIPKK